jgi:hypothetical protein
MARAAAFEDQLVRFCGDLPVELRVLVSPALGVVELCAGLAAGCPIAAGGSLGSIRVFGEANPIDIRSCFGGLVAAVHVASGERIKRWQRVASLVVVDRPSPRLTDASPELGFAEDEDRDGPAAVEPTRVRHGVSVGLEEPRADELVHAR